MHSRQLQGYNPPPSAAPRYYYLPPHPPQGQPLHTSSPSQNSLGILSPPLTPEDPHHSTKTRSEHVEPGPYGYYPHSTNDVARRGIMPPSSSPSSLTTRPNFTFPTLTGISNTEFTFRILPQPGAPLSFPPKPPPPRLWKRRRAVADVDGEHSCLHKKKRRLRLFLITSRLSPQFSHPATNIVDRGNSKIAVWAKQKALGRNILRKAAILNRIRRQSICALETAGGLGRVLVEQEKEQEQLQLARLTLMYGSHDTATRHVGKAHIGMPEVVETRRGERVRSGGSSPASSTGSPSPPLNACDEGGAREYRSPNDAYAYSHVYPKLPRPAHLPLPPSPLGLSNYDALDSEDDIPDPYAHLDEEYEAEERIPQELDDAYPSRPPFPRNDFEVFKGQSQQYHSNFNILDPAVPVIGDFGPVEEDVGEIWPAVRRNFGRSTDTGSLPSSSLELKAIFVNSPSNATPQPPNPRSSLSPTSSSPNFAGLYVTGAAEEQRTTGGRVKEMEEERKRQRNLMFMSFGS